MSDRAQKLQKLHHLRDSVPFVSKSALSSILDHVKEQGAPDMSSAKHMREATRNLLGQANAYGPLILQDEFACLQGNPVKISYLNFLSFLHFCYKSGGSLHQQLCNITEPLGLLVYTDEIVPGNPLANHPSRKCWCVYISIKQLNHHLQSEDAWVTVCCVRSSVVQQLAGHMSQLIKQLLLSIFRSPWAEVESHGILLQEPPSSAKQHSRFRCCLSFFIQDGAAHKYVWSVKGDSGSRFCCLCKNVFSTSDQEEGISEVSKFVSASRLDLATSQEIFSSWDRMAARQACSNQQQWKLWQQAAGISFSPEAMLACLQLRSVVDPVKQFVHDWMHCLCSNGIISLGIFFILEEMDCWKEFGNYSSCWALPASFGNIKVAPLFEAKRVEKHKRSMKFNSTASELLTVLPILVHFCQNVCKEACIKQVECLASLLYLVELLQSTWYTSISWQQIQHAAEEVLRLWIQAGWRDNMMKKHHWLLHLSSAFKQHGMIVNCFCMERKNKTLSRFSNPVQNTAYFEQAVMEDVVGHELLKLSKANVFLPSYVLEKPTALPAKLLWIAQQIWPLGMLSQDFAASKAARLKFGSCSAGDVVLYQSHSSKAKWMCGQLECFVACGVQACAVLRPFEFESAGPSMAHALWKPNGSSLLAVPLQDVLVAVTHAQGRDGMTTLVPLPYR